MKLALLIINLFLTFSSFSQTKEAANPFNKLAIEAKREIVISRYHQILKNRCLSCCLRN